ncbi:MAG: peptidoglycan recognition protein family protein [Chloroflexota bacterium]
MQAITMAVIHYSGVDTDSTATAIANYQTTKPDGDAFPEIAYHFIVHQTGQIEQCHDLMTRTWHAGTLGNDRGVAICLPMLHGPTPLQAESAARLVVALRDRLGRSLKIVGHKELTPTQCPGPGWDTWKTLIHRPAPPAIRELVVQGIPVKWAFYDWYKRLETFKPGMLGYPLAIHYRDADGHTRQDFAGGSLVYTDQDEMLIRISPESLN